MGRMTPTTHDATRAVTLVDATAVAKVPALPLEGYPGVTYQLLWKEGKSVAGIMHIAPKGAVTTHTHRHSQHHMWVIAGTAVAGGRPIGPGSYIHVPAGTVHGIDHPGPEGCSVLYLYLRDAAFSDGDDTGPTAAEAPARPAAQARPGDIVVVRAHHVGERDRDGEVVEARGADGGPPYLVRWSDSGHETLLFPGSDAAFRHPGHDDPHTPDTPDAG